MPRIAIVGGGAIATSIVAALDTLNESDFAIVGQLASSKVPDATRRREFDALMNRCDIVVEAASHKAVIDYAPTAVDAKRLFLACSTGAFCRPDAPVGLLESNLLQLSAGALAGLDLLRTATLAGGLETVSLTSEKHPRALERPWMPATMITALRDATSPMEVFRGTAREAAEAFPASANVAATLGLLTVGVDNVSVTVRANPAATVAHHLVVAAGSAGSYEFSVRNEVDPRNPRTSAIVAWQVVRELKDIAAHRATQLWAERSPTLN